MEIRLFVCQHSRMYTYLHHAVMKMLQVAHAAQHDLHQLLVCTVDTDVVVLTVMITATLPADSLDSV